MKECTVEYCTKETHRNSKYCYAHYMKNWRYGTPTPIHNPRWKDISGQRFGTLLVIKRQNSKWLCKCDCGAVRLVQAGELHRTGDGCTCGIQGRHLPDDSGYGAAHDRVRKKYGPAINYRCFDCGGKAFHWSYQHDDINELYDYSKSVNPLAYSLDPEHYVPRCVRCHKLFDLNHIDSTSNVLIAVA